MGAAPSVPGADEAEALLRDVRKNSAEAARAIREADVLLLCTGAGFSADSGLAVYADVASIEPYKKRGLEYHDICEPHWQESEPELFWGFWGMCYNDYRRTAPHQGYAIIRSWRDRFFAASPASREISEWLAAWPFAARTDADAAAEPYAVSESAGAFFVFTSNVDAHSFDHFEAAEVRECHGNVEVYQCAAPGACSARRLWRAPRAFEFAVDAATMLAPASKSGAGGGGARTKAGGGARTKAGGGARTKAVVGAVGGVARERALAKLPAVARECERGFATNHPTCLCCGGPARPAILMFGDDQWLDFAAQESRYERWVSAVLHFSRVRAPEPEPEQSPSPPAFEPAAEPGEAAASSPEAAIAGPAKEEAPTAEAEEVSSPPTRPARPPLRFAILEIGCGGNVATVRITAENLARQVADAGGEVAFIRVNPELPCADRPDLPRKPRIRFIPVMAKGLAALELIDAAINNAAPS